MGNNNKTFNLADGITVQTDMRRKHTVTYIDCFSDVKSFGGYKPVLGYGYGGLTEYVKEFGEGFNLNVKERLDGNAIIDIAGYRNGANWSMYPPAFLNKLNETKKLITDTTHTFVGDETYCKSFDMSGKLTLVCDKNGNYTKIKYTTLIKKSGSSQVYIYPVAEIEDGNVYAREPGSYVTTGRNIYTFTYNNDVMLSEIKEERSGKLVKFSYTTENYEKYLTKIEFPNGKTYNLTFADYRNINITTQDSYNYNITGDNQSVKITARSTTTKVPGGTESTTLPPIINWQITFGDAIKIEDIDGNCEYYKLNTDGRITDYCKEANSKIIYAEKHEHTTRPNSNGRSEAIFFADESLLNKKPYSEFVFKKKEEYGECVSLTYDENERLLSEGRYCVLTSSGKYLDYIKSLSYNNDNTLKQENTAYTFYDIDDNGEINHEYYTYILDYVYDTDKRLTKRSSYFEEHKETRGMTVEEYVYDNAGRVTKVISYNSLEPTKVFIKEASYDLFGKLISETDGTGLKNVTYEYNDKDQVQAVEFPNGNRINYGYDKGKLCTLTVNNESGQLAVNAIWYKKGEVTQLSDAWSAVHFLYDNQRRLSEVDINYAEYCNFTYNTPEPDKLFVGPLSVTVNNAKGESFTCEEDKAHTYTEIKYGDATELKTTYLANGLIDTETDGVTGETVKYSYTDNNQLEQQRVYENGKETYCAHIIYDKSNRLDTIIQYGVSDIRYGYVYEWGMNGKLMRVSAGSELILIDSDNLGRYTGRTIKNSGVEIFSESIQYKEVTESLSATRTVNRQSCLPSKITYSDNSWIYYSYDDSGNITYVQNSDGKQIRYSYDELDRLVREDNEPLGKTYTFSYINDGNIYSRKEYAYTTGSLTEPLTTKQYSYYCDVLTKDSENNAIVYDAIGNPTQYRGMDLTWQKGKRLTSFGENTFEYDGRGRRIKKNGVRYYYDFEDKLIASADGMQYFYDNIGVAGFKYNGVYYTYKRDVQNNITGILDNLGVQVVEYVYDAWGNHTVSGSNTALGNKNPFRYRSYFYDNETGLYFLKTRYYDPAIGRFINSDSVAYADPENLNGLNLYAYCLNNPVNYCDPSGHFIIALGIIALLAFTPLGGTLAQIAVSSTSYIAMSIVSLWDADVRNDMNAIGWNPFNTDENAVLNSSKVSFYKGMPVYRTNWDRSGTYYAMFLSNWEYDIRAVQHERGHGWQSMMMGIVTYGLMIGLPSKEQWSTKPYYIRPWEITADEFGGVNRGHNASDISRGWWYLAVSSIFGPFGYFFLLGEF